MKKSIRLLIRDDIRYQRELVFFLMCFDTYYNKVKTFLDANDPTFNKWNGLKDIDKRVWIQNVLIPLIYKYESNHFKVAYFNLLASSNGRNLIKFLKENEPEQI